MLTTAAVFKPYPKMHPPYANTLMNSRLVAYELEKERLTFVGMQITTVWGKNAVHSAHAEKGSPNTNAPTKRQVWLQDGQITSSGYRYFRVRHPVATLAPLFYQGTPKEKGGQTPLRCNRPTPLELRNMSNRRNLEPRMVELLAQTQNDAGLLELLALKH